MTWFASGPAIAGLGSDLTDASATGIAFQGLTESDRDDLGRDEQRRLRAAIFRSTSRWDGYSDDSATPLRTLPQGDNEPSLSQMRVEIDDQVAIAERTFAAFAVPAGVEEIEVGYFDDGDVAVVSDGWGETRPGYRMSGDGRDTFVLVDAFVGNNTVRQVAMQKVTDGVARIRLRLGGRVAVLVGIVLRVSASARAAGARDLTWRGRLHKSESEHAGVAHNHPRLETLVPNAAEIGVFVHGTFSTCVPALAEFGAKSQIPLYRYEHDTMRPIAENAAHLASELERIGSRRVKLLGHSRGGLVATLVGARLPQVSRVLTFGAPHNGTPVAVAMDGLLAYATVAAGIPAGSMVAGGLTAALLGTAIPGGRLPDGWTDMHPHSSFIQTLPLIDRTKVRAYGGVFDGTKPDLGAGPAFKTEVMATLMAEANDLVVPVASSTPVDLVGTVLDQVDHFSYFREPDVHAAVAKVLVPTLKKVFASRSSAR